MIDWDNEHYQYQNGFIGAGFFKETTTKAVKALALWWRGVGLTEGRKGFREYVDRTLDDAPKNEQ